MREEEKHDAADAAPPTEAAPGTTTTAAAAAPKDDDDDVYAAEPAGVVKIMDHRTSSSRLGCALGVAGVILLVAGAVLIAVTEAVIRQGVRDAVVIDTNEKYDDRIKDVEHPYDVHMWNCTNLLAVLEGREPKVRFEQVSFKMTYHEENYAFDWHHNRETLSYKSWWVVRPTNDEESRRLDEAAIVNVNPVYLLSVAVFGATERNLFAGLSYLVVQSVDDLLDSYVSTIRAAMLPSYMLVLAAGRALPDEAAAWWVAERCPDDTLEAALSFWDPASPTSAVTQATYDSVWRADVEALATPATSPTLACLRETSLSAEYVEWAVPSSSNVTSWDLAKGAQFGSGLLTRLTVGGASSVLSLGLPGVIVAPELYGAFGVELTPAEGAAFLEVFSNETLSIHFVSTALFGNPLDLLTDPTFLATGLTIGNALQFIEYLYTYLAESYFLAGIVVGKLRDPATAEIDPRGVVDGSLTLNPDGTGIYNSGLFTRRSAREVLFGYVDRITEVLPASLVGNSTTYTGVLGVQYADIAEQEALNPSLIYEVTTGKRSIQKIREYTRWRDITDISVRNSTPGKDGSRWTCDPSSWEAQGYESCDVWRTNGSSFTMRATPVSQLGPFHEVGRRRKRSFKLWSTEVMRDVEMVFDHDVTVKGIRARRYRVADSAFHTANCTLEPTRCNPDNAFYRMDTTPSYIASMASTTGGGKSSVSYPAFGRMLETYRQQTEGLPAFVERTMDTYVDVEPLTGFFINGHLRLQYNSDLDDRQLTSALWSNVFDNNPNLFDGHVLFFPLLWFDDYDIIDGDDAKAFKRAIYLPRLLAVVFTAISLALGVGCVVASAILVARQNLGHCRSSPQTSSSSSSEVEAVVVVANGDDAR